MNIEDLVIFSVRNGIPLNSWDSRLVNSIYEQIIFKNSLTEKQGAAMVKILKRYHLAISAQVGQDILQYLENPSYRLGIRKINPIKRITVVEHNQYGKAIHVEFPFDQKIIEAIKDKKNINHLGQWNSEKKCWIFPLSENSVTHLAKIAQENSFEMDSEFSSYIDQYDDIVKNIEKYVPILVAENDGVKIRNFSQNSPIFPSENILKSVFEARKLGVLTWDENISDYLNTQVSNTIVKIFLDQDPGENFHVDCENTEISALTELIQYLSPTLFILPGGSELEKLQQSYGLLKKIGIDNNSISVMFRLGRDTDPEFNEFVKNHNLNNPITEHTSVIFVSNKFPKPVLKSSIKFHLVINMGQNNVHYTMRDFLKNHENLVFFSELKKQEELPFWLLAK